MISVLYSDGRYRPVVICEKCREPILDAELGMAAFDDDNDTDKKEGDYINVVFLHKGECDRTYGAGKHRTGGWNELSHFLFRVCHNAGLSIENSGRQAQVPE